MLESVWSFLKWNRPSVWNHNSVGHSWERDDTFNDATSNHSTELKDCFPRWSSNRVPSIGWTSNQPILILSWIHEAMWLKMRSIAASSFGVPRRAKNFCWIGCVRSLITVVYPCITVRLCITVRKQNKGYSFMIDMHTRKKIDQNAIAWKERTNRMLNISCCCDTAPCIYVVANRI